jgi:hypothetical protein
MKWEKASAIAEIVSSVAVLVTLVYVGIQTRELAEQTQVNSAAIIGSSRQAALNAELQMFRFTADYPASMSGRAASDDDETVRRYMAAFSLLRVRENQWLEYRDKQLDPATWKSYVTIFVGLLATDPFVLRIWRQYAPILDQGFVSDIEPLLASTQQQLGEKEPAK